MLGLNFLVANQIDQAIDELSKAAQAAGDPLEIHLILGNLYREKGQVGRAIQEHQALLQRPKLRKLEHANVLLCLGLDYRSGGFVDRAIEAFTEVLKLDPQNGYALSNLEKLHEDQHQWDEAYAMRQKLAALADGDGGPMHRGTTRSSRSSKTSSAQAALKRSDYAEAARRFEARHRSRRAQRAGAPEPRRRARTQEGRRRRGRASGSGCIESRPSAPTWPSRGSKRAYTAIGRAGSLRRSSASG